MKKLALILAVLLALSLASCSNDAPNAPDTPNTPEITTSTPDTSANTTEAVTDETAAPESFIFTPDSESLSSLALSAYKGQIALEDFLDDQAVQEFILKNLSEMLNTEIHPSDMTVHVTEIGAMYPMTIILSHEDGYDIMINFSTFEEGNFRYSNRYKLYGRYEKDGLMQTGGPEYHHINRADVENAVLEAADVDDITVKYGAVSLSETERTITVPMLSGSEPYAALLKIEDDLTYTVQAFEKLDFSAMSAYDFLVTYQAFGLEPLDLLSTDYGIPLSPENAITDTFGTLEVLENMYAFSEFSYSTLVRLRTNTQSADESKIDVSFYLVDKQTGEKINTATLSPDADFEDLVWKIMS